MYYSCVSAYDSLMVNSIRWLHRWYTWLHISLISLIIIFMQMFDLPETLNRQEQIFLRANSGIFLFSLEEEFLDEKLMRYDYHFFFIGKDCT